MLFTPCLALLLTGFPQDPPSTAAVDAVVASHMERDRIPGVSLAIVHHGKEVLAKGYGLASVELHVPVTPATVFPIASVTKTFTAVVVLSLVEDGKLTLDQTLGGLLDGMPEAWREVTLRQLLSHTSGLPDVIVDPVKGTWLGTTRADAIDKAGKLPLQFPRGTQWSYNQTNYLLLGAIVEKLTGKTFDEVVQELILSPLKLQHTGFGDAEVVVPDRGTWYTAIDWDGQVPRRSKQIHPCFVSYPTWMHTAAALNTTASELAQFAEAVAAGVLLTTDSRDTLWTATMLADGKPFRLEGTLGVGLGWLVDDRPGHRAVGGTGGSTVAFRHYVDDALTVVVLTNLQGHDPDAFVDDVARAYLPALAPTGR